MILDLTIDPRDDRNGSRFELQSPLLISAGSAFTTRIAFHEQGDCLMAFSGKPISARANGFPKRPAKNMPSRRVEIWPSEQLQKRS
jgi:hypothetical protein